MSRLPVLWDMMKQCSSQTKDTPLDVRSKGSWRQIILWLLRNVRYAHTGYRPKAWASSGAASEHRDLTDSVFHLGSSPGCSPMGHWLMLYTGIWQHVHLCSALQPQETCPPPDIWLKLVLRISKYFWSQIQAFKTYCYRSQTMFTGCVLLRAVSCSNQGLACFVLNHRTNFP